MYHDHVGSRTPMSLSELIAGVEAHEKTLTVVDPSPGVVDALRDHFSDRNVAVEAGRMDAGPEDYVVLADDGEFVVATSVDDLLEPEEPTEPSFADHDYRPIIDHLDETMFTSYDRGRMLAASREIEDRAWRVGRGELHAGFQYGSNFEPQREAYERLGGRDDLTVHAYVHASGDDPAPVEDVNVHHESDAEVRETWVVAFDGGGVEESKCALVAEERDGGFFGFWTYDPSTVDYVVNHLRATYVTTEEDGGHEAPGSGRS